MKITQVELFLTHSPGKNAPTKVQLFSIFYFNSVAIVSIGIHFGSKE